jgi:hypothetical protein
MQVERLKALKMYEERDMRRKADQKSGALVIIDQIRERERERVRQLELQDQERDAMLRQNDEMKQEEVRQIIAKKEAGKKLLEEVAASNAGQIELKKQEKDKLKEEDLMIQVRIALASGDLCGPPSCSFLRPIVFVCLLRSCTCDDGKWQVYLRDREKRDQERQQREDAIKAEKERETARLRAQQEKLKDKQVRSLLGLAAASLFALSRPRCMAPLVALLDLALIAPRACAGRTGRPPR